MSKKTKDIKGMSKLKTANGAVKQTKAIVGKGPSKRPAPVVKIGSCWLGRLAKRRGKEAKSVAPKARQGSPSASSGLRGAAPWAARHAAKHAAEARARAAEPPPPGSARATIRVPTGAEELKAKIGELHNALVQIRSYRKNLNKGFFDIGGRPARRAAAQAVRGQGVRFVRGVPRARDRPGQDHVAQADQSSAGVHQERRRSSTAWTRSLRPCKRSMLRPTRRARAVLRPRRPRRRRTRVSRFP